MIVRGSAPVYPSVACVRDVGDSQSVGAVNGILSPFVYQDAIKFPHNIWSWLSGHFTWEGDCGRTYDSLVAECVDNLGDIYGIKDTPFITHSYSHKSHAVRSQLTVYYQLNAGLVLSKCI